MEEYTLHPMEIPMKPTTKYFQFGTNKNIRKFRLPAKRHLKRCCTKRKKNVWVENMQNCYVSMWQIWMVSQLIQYFLREVCSVFALFLSFLCVLTIHWNMLRIWTVQFFKKYQNKATICFAQLQYIPIQP